MGIEVVHARDGQLGLEKSLEQPYNLILLDMVMPVVDGQEFISRLRGEEGNPNQSTPILIITGNEGNLKKESFEGQGILGIMEKPIDFDKLSRWTEEFFKES